MVGSQARWFHRDCARKSILRADKFEIAFYVIIKMLQLCLECKRFMLQLLNNYLEKNMRERKLIYIICSALMLVFVLACGISFNAGGDQNEAINLQMTSSPCS